MRVVPVGSMTELRVSGSGEVCVIGAHSCVFEISSGRRMAGGCKILVAVDSVVMCCTTSSRNRLSWLLVPFVFRSLGVPAAFSTSSCFLESERRRRNQWSSGNFVFLCFGEVWSRHLACKYYSILNM